MVTDLIIGQHWNSRRTWRTGSASEFKFKMKLNQCKSIKSDELSKTTGVSEDLAVVRANKALLDPKVTLDNPAHQAQSESEVYRELKEFEVLPVNRVFLVFTARME